MSVKVVETRYSHLKFESRQQVLLSDSSSIWERIEPFPSRFIKTLENLEMKRRDLSYFQTNEKKHVEFKRTYSYLGILWPDHLQLTLLNWTTVSDLALNKKMKFSIDFQSFVLCQNTFGVPIE